MIHSARWDAAWSWLAASLARIVVFEHSGHYPHEDEAAAFTQAMASLAERYYNVLQAPHKELIWFKSDHSMTEADTSQFVDVMVNIVLAQTYP